MKYVRSLDGLRSVAVSLVLLFHFHYTIEAGWIGVQLFFVLSGYLITSILIETKSLGFKKYLKRFYWRRVLRIFPLYYAYILFVVVIFLIAGLPKNFPDTLPYLLTYTYNFVAIVQSYELDIFFTHFWSLAIEEQFYMFWPFLIFFLNKRGIKIMLIIVILLSPIIRWLFAEYLDLSGIGGEHTGELVYRFTPSQFDSFAIGALIPVFNLNQLKTSVINMMWGISFLIILIFAFNYWEIISTNDAVGITSFGLPIGSTLNYQHVWSYTAIGFLSMFAIILLNKSSIKPSLFSKLKRWIFENKVMVEIGRISYGIYVYHWIILAPYRIYIHPKIQNHLISFLVYFAIVYFVSWVSFQLLEKQFLKLKDKRFNF